MYLYVISVTITEQHSQLWVGTPIVAQACEHQTFMLCLPNYPNYKF